MTSKLYYPTQAEAQAVADRIHADMIASVPAYAKSVADGQTKRWSIPAQDLDDKGNLIGTEWYVVIKPRAESKCTPAERAKYDQRADGKTPEDIMAAQQAKAEAKK